MRQKATAALIATAIVVSAPMTVPVVAGDTGDADRAMGATTQSVTVANAQVGELTLDNATIDNVTIEALRIDRLTVENQTGLDDVNQTLGAENDVVVLRNVSFEALSLENASAEGLGISAAGVLTNNPNATETGGVANATIERMNVDNVTIEQLDVDEREGGGVISGIVDFIRGLFGGDGDDEANETATPTDEGDATATPAGDDETATPMDDEEADDGNTFLVVQNVSVEDLTIQEMDVGTLATSEAPPTDAPTDTPAGTATETPTATPTETPAGTPTDTGNLTIAVVENVTVESATIESIETERLSIETATPASTPIFTPTDSGPTPV